MTLPKITGPIINNRFYLPHAHDEVFPEIQGIKVQKVKLKKGTPLFNYLWNQTKVFYKEKILRWERVSIIDTNATDRGEETKTTKECLLNIRQLAKQLAFNSPKEVHDALQPNAPQVDDDLPADGTYDTLIKKKEKNTLEYLNDKYYEKLRKKDPDLHAELAIGLNLKEDDKRNFGEQLRQLSIEDIWAAIHWSDEMKVWGEEVGKEGDNEGKARMELINLAVLKKRYAGEEKYLNYNFAYVDLETKNELSLDPPDSGQELGPEYLMVKGLEDDSFKPFLEVFPKEGEVKADQPTE